MTQDHDEQQLVDFLIFFFSTILTKHSTKRLIIQLGEKLRCLQWRSQQSQQEL